MVIEWLRIVVYVHWNDRRLIISGVKIFSTNNCHLALWPPVNKWNFSTAHVFACRARWCWFVPFKVINFFSEYHKLWNIFHFSVDCVIYFVRSSYVNWLQKFYFYISLKLYLFCRNCSWRMMSIMFSCFKQNWLDAAEMFLTINNK